MRGNLGLFVSSADRARLAAIVADRNNPQKHVWRAQVVLLTGDRLGTAEIMRRTDLSKPSVWRWQQRYIEAGVDGLLRDKTRPSRIPKLADVKVAEVVRLTLEEPPPADATHWTVRAMAERSSVSTAPPRSADRVSFGDRIEGLLAFDGAPDLAGERSGAASLSAVQAVQRSGLRD